MTRNTLRIFVVMAASAMTRVASADETALKAVDKEVASARQAVTQAHDLEKGDLGARGPSVRVGAADRDRRGQEESLHDPSVLRGANPQEASALKKEVAALHESALAASFEFVGHAALALKSGGRQSEMWEMVSHQAAHSSPKDKRLGELLRSTGCTLASDKSGKRVTYRANCPQ